VTVTSNKEVKQKIDYYRNALGFNTSPFDAWMLSRSLKTLAVRMEKHQENAIAVAEYLDSHPKVKKVYFP
jgi:cystathionine beta-lyase/cystathionine gamma-synthase